MVFARSRFRCGYDSGGIWEALSLVGGKWKGGVFWVFWFRMCVGIGSVCL